MRQHIRDQKDQLQHALEKIQRIATRDELTGTANRRLMQEQMRQEFQRSSRSGAPVMVAMLDIDYFKRVNDTYGHQAGDRSLQMFAQVCRTACVPLTCWRVGVARSSWSCCPTPISAMAWPAWSGCAPR